MRRFTKKKERTEQPLWTVTIERILPGGLGLAHADGRTVLVALAAPGDVVRVRVDRVQGRTAFASLVEIIAPSPVRVTPPCRYFGACGGCDWQQLSYEAQLDAKRDIIADCLRRIAKTDPPDGLTVVPAPRPWAYRTRAAWQRDGARLGYFARRSHHVCDVSLCPILAPPLQEAMSQARAHLHELPREVTELHAQAGAEGATVTPFHANDVPVRVGKHLYRLQPGGFFQSSQDLLEALIAYALDEAEGATALDLYCGVGLFTLPLAERFARVVGVEASLTAVEFAQVNLIAAGLSHAEAVYGQVSEWLRESGAEFHEADFVLLDPPRTGLEAGGVEGLLALAPRRIAYVSCDPATLARDLKLLLDNGYRLAALKGFDLFPQTHHVETVAHLQPA